MPPNDQPQRGQWTGPQSGQQHRQGPPPGYPHPGPPQRPQYGQPHYGHPQQGGQYAAPPPPPAPQKRRRVWPFVLLGMVLVPILGFAGCAALIGGAASSVSAVSGPVTVRYELTGDGDASAVTYSSGGNGTNVSQESSVSLPWTKEVTIDDGLMGVVTLGASNGESGSITCKVTNVATGKVIAEGTGSGAYAAVGCTAPVNGG